MTKFNDMLEATRLYAEQILWQVQLRHYPDSVRVPVSDALRWQDEQPAFMEQRKKEFFEDYADLKADQQIVRLMWGHKHLELVAQHRAMLAGSLSLCLQYPVGVFYTCCEGRYRGFRYGTEGSEYISGFGRY